MSTRVMTREVKMGHDPWEPPFSHGKLASSGTGEYEKKFWAEIFRVTARRWNPTPLRGISTEIFAIVYSDITTLVFSENTPFVCQHVQRSGRRSDMYRPIWGSRTYSFPILRLREVTHSTLRESTKIGNNRSRNRNRNRNRNRSEEEGEGRMDDVLRWRVLPMLVLLASSLVLYVRILPKVHLKSISECSLLPYDHYWITSKRIVTPQGVIKGAVSNECRTTFIINLVNVLLCNSHAHLDEPGRVEWEGFSSGTKAAAAGTQQKSLLRLHRRKFMWMSSFMCPSGINDFPMTNSTHIKEGLYVLAKYHRPLLVHAEVVLDSKNNEGLLDDDSSCGSYSTYLKSRPPSW
ncbi:hypothetical protein B296_00019270 [Ensete ventricosum]|uniref:Allantoinase composite domain-containing protein n=1 Tax=Ensete ventricosum TaxID=4639 RepID=A0A427B2Z4_ENSVE|nr:hypothetical protein B296_00019270 [Ensete ventricosum]